MKDKLKKSFLNYLVFTFGILSILYFNLGAIEVGDQKSKKTERSMRDNIRMFSEALDKLYNNYVDTLTYNQLIESAIKGMTNALDIHTTFMEPEDYDDLKTSTQGSFGGIGIQIGITDNILTVIAPIEGTPAHKLGILAGDKIIEVDGKSTKGWTTDDAIKVLRGTPGTSVKIKIARIGIETPLTFEIVRDVIKIKSVPYYFMLSKDVGYIRLTEFSMNSAEDLRAGINELEKMGMKKLIFDLRSNPGGLLNSAVDVLDIFLEKGKLLVYSKGRIPDSFMEYYSRTEEKKDYPIAVLIDGGTASASEIVSGGLQDYDKAVILGTNSYGKGTVQRPYPLIDNYALKITIAKYYTPSGRNINKDRNNFGDLIAQDSTKAKPEFKTANGRTVYGGGGIVPDIELKQETYSKFMVNLIANSIFFDTAIKYYSKFNKEPTSYEYGKDKDLWQIFENELKDKKIEYTQKDIDENKEKIALRVKSELIGRMKNYEEKSKVLIENDPQVIETLKLLEKSNSTKELLELAEKEKNKNKSKN